MTDKTADFTQGSILKKLVAFMMPVLGALILQAAYGAVDLLVVGRFGSTSGLSAVSTGSQVLNLVTFVVVQFAMGITVLIARYLGEKRPEQIGSVIGGAAIVFTTISVGLFIVMVCFAHPIAILMQAPAEAIEYLIFLFLASQDGFRSSRQVHGRYFRPSQTRQIRQIPTHLQEFPVACGCFHLHRLHLLHYKKT